MSHDYSLRGSYEYTHHMFWPRNTKSASIHSIFIVLLVDHFVCSVDIFACLAC